MKRHHASRRLAATVLILTAVFPQPAQPVGSIMLATSTVMTGEGLSITAGSVLAFASNSQHAAAFVLRVGTNAEVQVHQVEDPKLLGRVRENQRSGREDQAFRAMEPQALLNQLQEGACHFGKLLVGNFQGPVLGGRFDGFRSFCQSIIFVNRLEHEMGGAQQPTNANIARAATKSKVDVTDWERRRLAGALTDYFGPSGRRVDDIAAMALSVQVLSALGGRDHRLSHLFKEVETTVRLFQQVIPRRVLGAR